MTFTYFRQIGFGVLLASLCLGARIPAAAQIVRPEARPPGPQPVPGMMKMRLENNLITADIQLTPLQQVLEELAAQTGIIFEVTASLNPPLSVKLYRVSVLEAIQRIVGVNDSILYYGLDAAGQTRIELVKIFPKGLKGQNAGLRYFGKGVPTKSAADTPETPTQALKALAESKSMVAREKAVEVLAATPGEVSIQALTLALEDTAVEVKVAAIEGLKRLGARSAVPQIIQAFKHPHPGVRQSAIEAVALLGNEDNVKDLRRMASDKDEGVAAAAALAIRKLSGKP